MVGRTTDICSTAPTSLRHDSQLGTHHILSAFCRPTTLPPSGRWTLVHQSPGGCPSSGAPGGVSGQKRYHGCGLRHPWWAGRGAGRWRASITSPAVQAARSPLCGACSGCNPTWPPAWQGPMLIWVTEQHESLPPGLARAPPRTVVTALQGPDFFFNSSCPGPSRMPDMSSSLFSAYRLKRIWLFPKLPQWQQHLKQCWEATVAAEIRARERGPSQRSSCSGEVQKNILRLQVHWDEVGEGERSKI